MEFKIGDRVEYVGRTIDYFFEKGDIYTITNLSMDDSPPEILLNNGYYVAIDEVRPLPSENKEEKGIYLTKEKVASILSSHFNAFNSYYDVEQSVLRQLGFDNE